MTNSAEAESPAFDVDAIVTVLDRHGVRYVVVGGFAAQLHGARRPTTDVTPATTVDNLERLSAALRELKAGIRVNDLAEGLPFNTSADALLGMKALNLRTPHGDLDLTFSPAGFSGGYAELTPAAESRTVGGVTIRVAALADIIYSKTEASRVKDLEALPELHQLAGPRRQLATRNTRRRPNSDPIPPPQTVSMLLRLAPPVSEYFTGGSCAHPHGSPADLRRSRLGVLGSLRSSCDTRS